MASGLCVHILKHNKINNMQEISSKPSYMALILFIIVIALFALIFSSCRINGYGCDGKGRIITRVKQ